MIWAECRDRYYTAKAAVEDAHYYEEFSDLAKHPVIVAALIQIEMAERAIESVANQISIKYHDGDDE
ncbi:MAG TPA: hypothetical protein VFM10_02640 [Terriglobales bacterium]|nr:hypothetical protein [Terriglobales bacterium]